LTADAPWRDLTPDYGHWSNVHRRFISWKDKGIWEKLMEILINNPDNKWLMIDASHCKVHPHAAGAIGGNQETALIDSISAEYLLADRGYDSSQMVETTNAHGIEPVIPPKKNRKHQRYYDTHLYKYRHLVENAFLHLKKVERNCNSVR
jgi:transposase